MREERREAEAEAARPAQREPRPARTGDGRRERTGPSKNAVRRAGDLEREVELAEAALAALEDELADPSMWSSPSRRERNAERHARAKRAVTTPTPPGSRPPRSA